VAHLRRADAQLALEISLSERNATVTQDIVGSDGVKVKVREREREEESFRGESKSPRADLQIQMFARPAVDFVRGEGLERRFRLGDPGPQVGKRNVSS